MILIDEQNREIEITERNWVLAEGLNFRGIKGRDNDVMIVNDVNDITPELSAWGIPWKWK